jgi:perosamine synthetase
MGKTFMKYPLFYPFIPYPAVMDELADTLKGPWIGQAHKVDEFERKFADKYGYKHVLFVNSCTAALELSYHLLDLKKGDEVIVPVLDCTAGQTGLIRRGVKIVFADITDDLTVSYEDIKKKITNKTKAIIAVNLGGLEVDSRIYKLKLPIITDSAQHLGWTRGDYICYSFQAIKHITTGDGGILVLKNKKEYDRAKKLRWFGIDREAKKKHDWQPWVKRKMTMDIEEAGYKYQPTDIDACFGLAGLRYADRVVDLRQKLTDEYIKFLPGIKRVCGGTAWLMGIVVDNRDEVAAHLKSHDIETNVVHLRNDIFEVMGGKRQNLPKMNELEYKYLYLPLHQNLTKDDIRFICERVMEVA